jgi:hypothetical protein
MLEVDDEVAIVASAVIIDGRRWELEVNIPFSL